MQKHCFLPFDEPPGYVGYKKSNEGRNNNMPTINQLIRKGRVSKVENSKSPALNKGYNSFKKEHTNVTSPQKRGVCTRVGTMTPKKTKLSTT